MRSCMHFGDLLLESESSTVDYVTINIKPKGDEPGVSKIVRCSLIWAHDTSICHDRQQWCTGAAPRPLTTTSWSFGYPTIKYPGSRGKKCSECGVNICLIAPHGPAVTLHYCHYVTPIQWPAPPSTGIYSPQWRIFYLAANWTLHFELFVLFILPVSHLYIVLRIFLLFFPIFRRKCSQAVTLLGTWNHPITASIYID